MAIVSGEKLRSAGQVIRSAFIGPHLAAFLPAIMLGAYWFGGEGVLLTVAVIFPALMAFVGLVTAPRGASHPRDAITGLPGRAPLLQYLDARLAAQGEEAPVCLAIAIDDLDTVARHHGAPDTEAIQAACGTRLRDALRESDFIARIGPGQFAVALARTPRVDLEAMLALAARLQDALATPIALDGAQVRVTASVGFALAARVQDQTGEAMLAAAESALTEAANAGPASIRAYSRSMRPRVPTADGAAKDVVQALESGQITPWFQPQISTDTGALTGFEALARWQHPERGMIAPGAFLPAIAHAGLFERLGEVILFHALSALREWDRAGLCVPSVSVNFSPEELRNPKLVDKVRWELDRFEITPDRLVVEVLEDVVAQTDDDTTVRNVAALAKLGCAIDLDDFGTGHASITNIRRFDVTRIKIDRSFVTHVDTDREQQNMVAAILMMAERLGLETLGEGVESHGEHAMLAQLGCTHVQGYSIAKPMPLEETLGWIRAHDARRSDPLTIPRHAG